MPTTIPVVDGLTPADAYAMLNRIHVEAIENPSHPLPNLHHPAHKKMAQVVSDLIDVALKET